jgi:hypothetical protein
VYLEFLHSLNLPSFLVLHTFLFYWSCQNFHRTMLNFPFSMFVLSTQFHNYTFKMNINHYVAEALSTFIWNSLILSYLVYCLHVICVIHCVQWHKPAKLSTLDRSHNMVARTRPVSVAQLVLCYCTECMMWKNVHYMHRKNI